jgi:hypothetical protein
VFSFQNPNVRKNIDVCAVVALQEKATCDPQQFLSYASSHAQHDKNLLYTRKKKQRNLSFRDKRSLRRKVKESIHNGYSLVVEIPPIVGRTASSVVVVVTLRAHGQSRAL